ncbi:MAG TPA: hypothetical protein V6C93_32355, partial [Allocoleopsis sp.]
NHTVPIPNSEVKRCSGEDTLGVTLGDNSSVPGLESQTKVASGYQPEAALVLSEVVDTLKRISILGTNELS